MGGISDSVAFDHIKGSCSIISGPYYYNPAENKWEESPVIEHGRAYVIEVKQDCRLGLKSEDDSPPSFPARMAATASAILGIAK